MNLPNPVQYPILSMETLLGLWESFADIPTVHQDDDQSEYEVDSIEESFLHFPVGTSRYRIWHWFEAQNPEFVIGELKPVRTNNRE